MWREYYVRQDGADFYLYDGSALIAVVSYPGRVADLGDAETARLWFKDQSRIWGWSVHF